MLPCVSLSGSDARVGGGGHREGKGIPASTCEKNYLLLTLKMKIMAAQMCAHFECSQNGLVERQFEPHILCIFHAFVCRFTIVRGELDRILYTI